MHHTPGAQRRGEGFRQFRFDSRDGDLGAHLRETHCDRRAKSPISTSEQRNLIGNSERPFRKRQVYILSPPHPPDGGNQGI
jgi:hypothetical protein